MDDLVILDDVFPNLLSTFRVIEFTELLRTFPKSVVLAGPCSAATPSGKVGFDAAHAEYADVYPDVADRVNEFTPAALDHARFAYVVFVNNAFEFLPLLEDRGIPFAVELYPGGGMALGQDDVDQRLERVLTSGWCRGVITTQSVTRNYVTAHGWVKPERLCHVWGGVLPTEGLGSLADRPARFGFGKPTLDVVFVANRYQNLGRDKGYDLFVEAARTVATEDERFHFHVVGPWAADGYPHPGLRGRMTFYGTLSSPMLRKLYQYCDISVSPNRPFMLLPGAYDGYPTGASVEAGLNGVAVLATDAFGERSSAPELVTTEISADPGQIATLLLELAGDPVRLKSLGEGAARTFRERYAPQRQLAPRVEFLRQLMRRA